MTIRITTTTEAESTIVKVDGGLQRKDADELARIVRELHGPASLDLSELQSVDRAAVALLRELIDLGAELRAASPYVRLLLEREAGRNPGTNDHSV